MLDIEKIKEEINQETGEILTKKRRIELSAKFIPTFFTTKNVPEWLKSLNCQTDCEQLYCLINYSIVARHALTH